MGLAKMNLEAEEQGSESGETYQRTRLGSWGTFLGTLRRVLLRVSPGSLERLRGAFPPKPEKHSWIPTEKRAMKVGVFGHFKVEGSSSRASSRLLDWRITATDQTTSLEHDFFIRDGQIYHVQFHSSPPWNHSTKFTVGVRVKRIMDSEKRAILQAIVGWS